MFPPARELRPMGPLSADHPMVVEQVKCAACLKPFQAGERVTLVAVGPGDDEQARRLCREGHFYNAIALPVHWACATGNE